MAKKKTETRWDRADQASSVLQTYALETRDGNLGDEGSDLFVETVVSFLTDLKHLLYRANPGLMITELAERAVDRWDDEAESLPRGGDPDD